MGWVVRNTPRPLYPRERPGIPCTGVWIGPQGRSVWVRKISPPPEFALPTIQPVASRYTDRAIADHTISCKVFNVHSALLQPSSAVSNSASLRSCIITYNLQNFHTQTHVLDSHYGDVYVPGTSRSNFLLCFWVRMSHLEHHHWRGPSYLKQWIIFDQKLTGRWLSIYCESAFSFI